MTPRPGFTVMLSALILAIVPAATHGAPSTRTASVDANGVLRWDDDHSEVALFGVNYYPPFHWNYRDLKTLGLDPRKVIDTDVAHFSRMGLDLIRLHVFDREISDEAGNLIDNEHLQLLDYLLARCKEHGIYALLTPIAWWACPEPTHGFSDRYPMFEMTTSPAAWQAETNYLRQFANHVNSYTGIAYKDGPEIIAFELINEPHYPQGTSDAQVTKFINTLYDALRSTGTRKPIFFNGWGGRLAATGKSKVDGVTFGWYPTGLVAGHELRRNFLPQVADYPQMRSAAIQGKAVGVYEFDAADVPTGYIYPAMARAFRAGGAQLAAQFQYDPLPLAATNADWQTHYLNLVYAPGKTLSFMIAAAAFHRLPRLHQFRTYPDNNCFGCFRVSYEQSLSEAVADDIFYYSNNTTSTPPHPERLQHIAGCGSSPVVSYDGTGAYFLDRQTDGKWKLTVFPDAVWVNDPFGSTNLGREVSRLIWRRHNMSVHLPRLDANFSITPGVYLLAGAGAPRPLDENLGVHRQEHPRPAVWWEPPTEWTQETDLPVTVTVASDADPAVTAVCRVGSDLHRLPLHQTKAYQYAGTVPHEWLQGDSARFTIETRTETGTFSFPGGNVASASAATPGPPVPVFNVAALTTAPELEGRPRPEAAKSSLTGDGALRLVTTGFNGKFESTGVKIAVKPLSPPPAGSWDVIVEARAMDEDTDRVELGLIHDDDTAYGFEVPLSMTWQQLRIPAADFHPLWNTAGTGIHPDHLQQISLVFGTWLYGQQAGRPHAFEIKSVSLATHVPGWQIALVPPDSPVDLFRAGRDGVRTHGTEARVKSVRGPSPIKPAVRVEVNGFGPPPSSVSFRFQPDDVVAARRTFLQRCNAVRITARAAYPATTALELVLIEDDGTPWGINLPLTTEWQELTVPFKQLKYWEHWVNRPLAPPDRRPVGQRIAAVNCCFGAWLFPAAAAQPHGIDIQSISLCQVPEAGLDKGITAATAK